MPLVGTGSKGRSSGIWRGFEQNIPEIDLKKIRIDNVYSKVQVEANLNLAFNQSMHIFKCFSW